jgi:three-Cys-motif partner protein
MERTPGDPRFTRRVSLPSLANYVGREQAYVKHYFLATYLEILVHKVARAYDELVYVDGYTGPWKSKDEEYADTSFVIALDALTAARRTWQGHGRDVRMKAILVEKRTSAHAELLKLQPRYPDVDIVPMNGDFRSEISSILSAIPQRAFAFFLIDPKGWRINIEKITPLLCRANSETLFNFMFEFINRAASMTAPDTVQGLDELLPIQGWRSELAAVEGAPEKSRPELRKRILIDAFRRVLTERGNYPYVADVPVLRPLRDRQIYSLIYATRSPAGIDVFRNCQIKTLVEQEAVRSATKVALQGATTGQADFFGTSIGLGPDPIEAFLDRQRQEAEKTLMDILGRSKQMTWGKLWPLVLARHAVRRPELNAIAAKLKKEGKVAIPALRAPKRVPSDEFEIIRLI